MSDEKKNKNVTLSIDRDVHTDFKIENVRNGADMSLTVENFMKNYIEVSRKLHAERLAKNKSNGEG